ncbi:MAG: hypothetical protein M3R44_02905 [Candidatus Eremiobacteraeota bacterium]|nr:hypothetical protein [Candidatus Eremiobacteraeota bacterium]
MLRYFAVATVLVVIVIVLVTGVRLGVHGPNGRTRYGTGTGTPGPAQRARGKARPGDAVTGFAPWALSALPECFTQTREVRGPAPYVRARVPAGLVDIPAGSMLRSSDCTVFRRTPARLDVERGSDVHLKVAAVRAFLTGPGRASRPQIRTLVLIVKSGAGLVLRRYSTRAGATITSCCRP